MSHYDEQREQAESKAMRPKYQRMKDLRALISAAEAGGRLDEGLLTIKSRAKKRPRLRGLKHNRG